MTGRYIVDRSLNQWIIDFPLLKEVIESKEVFWRNPNYKEVKGEIELTSSDIKDASERLQRFAPYIRTAFPETLNRNGIIESPLVEISKMQKLLEQNYKLNISGKLLLKCDHQLPISGSIKARGGIYEVLKHAEDLALEYRLIKNGDTYEKFNTQESKQFFSQFSLAVGSTGNLGLSIGIIGARLGFNVTVHMSADAKKWKKDLLRSKGVNVIEYQSDYSIAVEKGRKEALKDPKCYFIDDENSKDLFLGYAVAATRLKKQLDEMDIVVDERNPLFVYLPCGVGGGPGGITFGLKEELGNNVHCFFAEPTPSPSFLIGQMTGLKDNVSVFDFGLDNKTDADGLAVGRPSRFVGKTIEHILSGCYTINDQKLYEFLKNLAETESFYLEPSACAGFYGPIQLLNQQEGNQYILEQKLTDKMSNATHLVWATGGSMVPPNIMQAYLCSDRHH